MSGKISVGGLADAILSELAAYTDEITQAVDEDVTDVAKEAAEKLRETSPKSSGKYSKSWKAKCVSSTKGNKRVIVYNKEYRLTHLLEKGHVIKKNGRSVGHADAAEHIRPVEEWAVNELQKRIKEDINGDR